MTLSLQPVRGGLLLPQLKGRSSATTALGMAGALSRRSHCQVGAGVVQAVAE